MTLIEAEPPSVDHNFEEPVARDFAGRPVHPKGWQTIKVNFERHCRLRAEVERKYLFLVFYDPESIECFQRHDIMTKHEGLSSFLATNFVQVMVPNTDPFCDLYLDELFPINAFPFTAVHDPVTMGRIAVFADLDRKSFKEGCIKRRLDYLSDPDELLGELATIVDDLPQLPEPSEELLRLFGLPQEARQEPVPAVIFDCDRVPTLDEAVRIAQATGRYLLISIHADASSEASRNVNRDLWYYDAILHTLHNKYVVVRLDADVDPIARRILHTPLTGSEPEARAHAAPPYLEVMHPFEPLRIPIFSTDPHPVTTLGWTHADAPPALIVSYETRDWPDGHGVAAVGAMKLQDASRQSNAGAAAHAQSNGDGAKAVASPTPGTNGMAAQVQASVGADDAAWELVENVDEEL
ncbi:hypothetical protein AMAG_06759 [Allomyces macrogynus ATCC 38327]|uniref:Thioredoxin domain-containing protein n=1 Tax=Allomyces macrogynus (strain ATCC 38327) TaxID=578462 RepID=A0A0L0SEY7_ALLM3|nr:hypothetical protein AMAG_06759 [Allomyces macrogynus ATCC 38327]|eukprot:KNE60997.1 hypothetical protein AMAG_06759 [Allomyces macrogynus ATCC 38327]